METVELTIQIAKLAGGAVGLWVLFRIKAGMRKWMNEDIKQHEERLARLEGKAITA